jgi:hypothetical protein
MGLNDWEYIFCDKRGKMKINNAYKPYDYIHVPSRSWHHKKDRVAGIYL